MGRETIIYIRTKEYSKDYQFSPDDLLKSGLVHEILSMLIKVTDKKCIYCNNETNYMRNDDTSMCWVLTLACAPYN